MAYGIREIVCVFHGPPPKIIVALLLRSSFLLHTSGISCLDLDIRFLIVTSSEFFSLRFGLYLVLDRSAHILEMSLNTL